MPLAANSEGSIDPKNIYAKPLQTIGSSVIGLVETPLKDAKKHLQELQSKQAELVIKLHSSNIDICEVQHSEELQQMFLKLKLYHGKLQACKKDIKGLYERSQKLKSRAVRLKELKEREPGEEIIVTRPTSVISAKGST